MRKRRPVKLTWSHSSSDQDWPDISHQEVKHRCASLTLPLLPRQGQLSVRHSHDAGLGGGRRGHALIWKHRWKIKWVNDQTVVKITESGGRAGFYSHTMRRSADVSGHARPALPRPTICSHIDPVLGVHLQVPNFHILGEKKKKARKRSCDWCFLSSWKFETNHIKT